MAPEYKVKVISKIPLTSHIWDVVLELEDPKEMDFIAGQCVSFHVAEKQKRLYSIVNTPDQKNRLTFCLDVSPMGEGSKMILGFKEGDTFVLEGPHGIFTVKDFERDLLFVCTGAGVAPFKSIITDALQKGFGKKVTLLFGVRNQENAMYFEYFQELADKHSNFEFIPTLSKPNDGWTGSVGRVTTLLTSDPEKYKGRLAYLCGSLDMIKDTRAVLIANGQPMKDIKIENFG